MAGEKSKLTLAKESARILRYDSERTYLRPGMFPATVAYASPQSTGQHSTQCDITIDITMIINVLSCMKL